MRSLMRMGFSVIILLISSAAVVYAYSGGSGTAADPYLISTPADINALGANFNDWDKSFKLTADINMSGYTGMQYKIIGNINKPFTGTFDGDGHIIRNLTYTTAGVVGTVGLFGYTSNATIKNLGLEDVNIQTGGGNTGGLAGEQYYGTIISCHSTGSVTVTSTLSPNVYTGGLVGYQNYGSITFSYSAGSVTASNSTASSYTYTGGLVGYQSAGSATSCYSTSLVNASTTASSAHACTGGLVGYLNNNGTIIACHSMGPVTASATVYSVYTGGLLGEQYNGLIACSYSTGSVNSTAYSTAMGGGLVGWQYGGSITSSYSTGNATSTSSASTSYAGGLVGVLSYGYSITSCYSTGNVASTCSYAPPTSAYAYAGGLVASCIGSITDCFSTGQVSATGNSNIYKGGLIGIQDGSATACFWDVNTSGMTTSAGGTGETTAQMKTLSTFTSAGWDFTNETANGTADIWRMCTYGVDYPRLNWQSTAGDLACPDGVNFVDFSYFAGQWTAADCNSSNNFCGGTDMDFSGAVDMADLIIFADNWLQGI